MHIFDIGYLIESVGILGVLIIVFIESGFFFGFFLPGDSLLFAAGFAASQGAFSFPILLGATIVVAILSSYVGYLFGEYVGHHFFDRKDSFFFRKSYLEKTHQFFEKYGTKTIVLSRFVPIVRSFAPSLAGVGDMSRKKFIFWAIIGGILWPTVSISSGYYLGRFVPGAEKYFIPAVIVVVLISILPGLFEWYKNKKML